MVRRGNKILQMLKEFFCVWHIYYIVAELEKSTKNKKCYIAVCKYCSHTLKIFKENT